MAKKGKFFTEASAALREARLKLGLNQQQLGDLVKATQTTIGRLENGEIALDYDWAITLSPHIGIDLVQRFFPAQASQPTQPREEATTDPADEPLHIEAVLRGELAPPNLKDKLPVLGAARGGPDQEMFMHDYPIDYAPRPSFLEGLKEAYALEVTGDSMVPMYRPRQVIEVNPRRRPSAEKGVVIWKRNRAVLVKEYVRRTATHLIVREYQPVMREFSIPLDEVQEVHTIVGIQDD